MLRILLGSAFLRRRRGHAWRDEGEAKGLSFLLPFFFLYKNSPLWVGQTSKQTETAFPLMTLKKLIIFIGPKLFIAQ
jgi:hypothetical protein